MIKGLNEEQKNILINIARDSVEEFIRFDSVKEFSINDEDLNEKRGAFVTIHKDKELRGCIGQIVPSDKSLYEVIRDMAISACSKDDRFEPIVEEELNELDYEISVLSVPELINSWENIKLGEHGVIIRKDNSSGVFLPQVAIETGWSLEEFLSQLRYQKLGIPADSYKTDKEVEIYVFSAEVFKDSK